LKNNQAGPIITVYAINQNELKLEKAQERLIIIIAKLVAI